MRIALRTSVVALMLWLVAAPAAIAQPLPGECDEGRFEFTTGARWKICVPAEGWNRRLIVFAHGYIPNLPGATLDFFDTLPDGTSIPELVQGLGFAYATTSYQQNGLAILQGVDDVRDVVELFKDMHGQPAATFIAGVSEGGLVAALLAERFPELFTGAYALCGPIGNFREQINYVGDFRVLFDYFFPGTFVGSPVAIAPLDVQLWVTGITPGQIAARLLANRTRALELMRTSRAAFDPADFDTVIQTTLAVLVNNILGANDAAAKLGGQPFDNRLRWYFGSSNDLRLNFTVARFAASPAALLALRNYNTSGLLRIPMVTLHTTSDETIPFAHELIYLAKVRPSDRGRFIPLPVFRYGHCNFTTPEILTGLAVLAAQR